MRAKERALMAANTVKCVKLGRELPGLDPNTPEGDQALKMVLLIAGPDTQKRVRESISAEAWQQWIDRMRMVINEFGLDPTSEEANKVLAQHMDAFFFGGGTQLPGYVPPNRSAD
jgi:Fe-S cluster biosynthesis and repair protein YggX